MTVIFAISLLHFLWQGALIAGAAWLVMRLVRSASARYLVGVGALLLMALAPIATAMRVRDAVVPGPASLVPGSPSSEVLGPAAATLNPRDPGRGIWDDAFQSVRVSPSSARWLLASWLIGVGLLSIRLSFGWWTARRLTRVDVRPPQSEILSRSERLMSALGITAAVRVLESSIVQVPTVVGWIKPALLLPVSAMSGLAMAQIEALVAHELAHIKRHDYLVNLFQSAIETLLFYHPAVWFLSRRVRHERELCCDDLAIAACGDDRLTYASALADLESLRQVPVPALGANGGSLLTRVKRILSPDDVQMVDGRGHWMAGVAILSATLVTLTAQNVQGRQGAQDTQGGQVAQEAQGVQDAQATQGVQGGVPGGVTDGVKSGIVGGIESGVSGGVKGGVVAAERPQQPLRVGGTVAPPERIKYVQPAYPQAAKDAHVSGVVIAEIVVDETGKVADATLIRSIALLDEAALDAVKQWRYMPTIFNGRPVPVIMTVTVSFTLADGAVDTGAPAASKSLSVISFSGSDEPTMWSGRELTRIGGAVKAPERTRYVVPVYPPEAQAARVTGIVIIQAVVDETGHVVEAKVIRSIALLDQAAIDAVMQWEYTPTIQDGIPVPVLMTVTVNFTLQSQK